MSIPTRIFLIPPARRNRPLGEKVRRWIVRSAILLAALAPLDRSLEAQEAGAGRRSWQLYFANDILAGSDDQFTNGIALYVNSKPARHLSETSGTPAFGKGLARLVLPRGEHLSYRESWGFGQNMQTPMDLEQEALILDDIPYVGVLIWTNTFLAFDDHRLTGVQTLFGWAGPTTAAEDVQRAFHGLIGDEEPRGWNNQLDDEPLLGLYYMKKRKLINRPAFDLSLNGDAALGNFFTLGQVAVEARVGRKPPGFVTFAGPIGRGMSFDGVLPSPHRTLVFATFAARLTGIAHALPRDGNSFRNDNAWTELHTVEKEEFVGQFITGLHVQRPHWGLHAYFWLSSDTLKHRSPLAPDEDNSFGALLLECRF